MSIFENQERFFVLTTPIIGLSDMLNLYTLKDNALELLQNISVTFTTTSDKLYIPFGHDFIVSTGLFNKR